MGGLNSGPGPGITLLIAVVVVLTQTALAAPVHEDEETQESNSHALAESHGCYYNFQHYNEGERILTNEPCLNCTCRNRMLMCYLRVCPFTKGIGQNCTVEKVPGQCCPIITCPEVPVQLLTSTTTEHSEGGKAPSHYYGNKGTAVGHLDTNGCNINGIFYPNGAQVPGSPEKPCELCYCIRNKTACIMQECALHVDGCRPVYEEGQCFPVRYQCDDSPYEEEPTTTIRPAPTPGLIITTTSSEPLECSYNDEVYEDGSRIPTEDPCEHCYCLKGKIACAVQECGAPLEKDGQNCTALPPAPGKCCPDSYQCDNNVIVHTKENFVRKDRKQKFEPKPVEHNDITMTSQGLSSGSEGTTQSGIPSVADAGHPTDGYHPDGVATEKPKLTTNRFDEESKVTEVVTPAKGIAESSVTTEHQQELDQGTQTEKDSRPVKPTGDQKITFPDELQPVKGDATVSPVDQTDAQVIHMSPEKQPHPEIESHKQGVTPQTVTDDTYPASSTPSVKDPLLDKLHNIIQDVQSQVGDGKTSQMPEVVEIQTTTQSQKGHFTEKPDILSHLPNPNIPGTEITNTTKESSPEDTNILNQIQGIIQGIYSHVTDSILPTKQPESTTEFTQPSGLQPSESEHVAGKYPEQSPQGSKFPEYPHGVTGRPEKPIATEYPEGVTGSSDKFKPNTSTKYPQKHGSHEEPYGAQHPDETGATGRPEGTTKYPGQGSPDIEKEDGKTKDPSEYSTGQHPVRFRPDGSKYPEAGQPEDQTKYPTETKPEHYPNGTKPEKYPDGTKYPEGLTDQPDQTTYYPEGEETYGTEYLGHNGRPTHPNKRPGSRPTGETGRPDDENKYPHEAKPGQYPLGSKYPTGVTGRPEKTTNYPEGAEPYGTEYPGKPQDETQYPGGSRPGQHPLGSKYPDGVTDRPDGTTYYTEGVEPYSTEYPGVSGRPKDPSKRPGTRPGDDQTKYPVGSKYPEGVTGQPGDKTEYPHESKPGQYPDGVTDRPEATTYYPEGQEAYGTEYPGQSGNHTHPSKRPGSRPGEVTARPEDGTKYPDGSRPGHYPDGSKYPDGVTGRPGDETKYPESVTGRPEEETKYPDRFKPEEHAQGTKYPEGVKPEQLPDKSKYPEVITSRPEDGSKYPDDSRPDGSKHPLGVTSRPQYPDGSKPGQYPDGTKYPEGVTGRPDNKTKYPAASKPEQYPNGVTYLPEGTTYHPEGVEHYATEHPGVSGRPEDPSKHPGTRPGEVTRRPESDSKYPDSSRPEQYPDGTKHPGTVTGRPEDESKYPDGSKYSEGATGRPEATTYYPEGQEPYGTEYFGVGGRPKDPSKRPGTRPGDDESKYPQGSKYPESVTRRPDDQTKYPYESKPGQYPDQSKHPYGVTDRPEGTTYYPEGEEPYETEYPGVSGRPKDPSKHPGTRPGDDQTKYPVGSKYPEGVTGQPGDKTEYPDGSKLGQYPDVVTGRPEATTYYPEGQEPYGTEYPGVSGSPKDPNKRPETGSGDATKYPDESKPGQNSAGSENPEGVTGRPDDETKHPDYAELGKQPGEVTGRPEDESKYPDRTKYPEGVSIRPDGVTELPEVETKYPTGFTGEPDDKTKYPHASKPGQYPNQSKHPYGVTDRPEGTTYYPDGEEPYGTEYSGVSGRPKDPSKRPGTRPDDDQTKYPVGSKYPEGVTGQPGDKTEYPHESKPGQYPDGVTGLPEATTYYPDGQEPYGTDYPGVSGRPKDPSKRPGSRPGEVTGRPDHETKYPDGSKPGQYPDGTNYPKGATGRPDDEIKYTDSSKPGEHPHGSSYADEVTDRPEGTTRYPEGEEPYGTEYPGHSGRPTHPNKRPGSRPTGETSRPEDETKYPYGTKPGQYPDQSKHPYEVTDRPEGTTYYPEGEEPYATEYPGVSGRPKDPSKHPGTRPGDDQTKFPDGSKYPEGVTGQPGDKTEYPDGSKPGQYPDGVTGRPEATTYYPDGQEPYGTEYPGVSGRPKDPSTRPGSRPGEVTGRPYHETKYPDGSKPEQHPDDSRPGHHPDVVTGRPEATTYYPEGQEPYGTEYPGVSGRPKDPSTRPGSRPGEVTGRPYHETKYPDGSKPEQHPDDSRPGHHPDVVTGRPEATTYYPEGQEPYGTEYPGVSGSPKYPNKRPGTRPSDETKYPDRSKPGQYPAVPENSEGVTGRPDDETKHPDDAEPGSRPGEVTGRPDHETKYPGGSKPGQYPYGTNYPAGVTGRPEDKTKYPEEGKPGQYPGASKHPEDVTGRPDDKTKYPDGPKPEEYLGETKFPYDVTGRPDKTKYPHASKPGQYPDGSKYPDGLTDRPEVTTNYQKGQEPYGTEYPGVSGRPKDPSKRPGARPGEVTGRPDGETKYPENLKPGQGPDESEYPEVVTGQPDDETKYPDRVKPGYFPGSKPGKPQSRPGVEDEPLGTEYTKGTESQYNPECGTEYPSGSTNSPTFSKYPSKRPSVGDENQQKPVSEEETDIEHGSSTNRPEQDSFPSGSKRPGSELDGLSESATERLKPSSTGHYSSGIGSTGQPDKKPEDFYGAEHPESEVDTERPHYTSKYPEKPSAEDQLLGIEQPDSKITSRPVGTDHAGQDESKHPYEESKHPVESSTESTTSKQPHRPGHPEDTDEPAINIPHGTTKYPEGLESSVNKVGDQKPEDISKQPGYPGDSKQPDQSVTKLSNTTKESTPDESTNILNQIQGIIQGIYSQVTDSIMSTIRPESTTAVGQEVNKPQGSDDYSPLGHVGTEQQAFGTELPHGVKLPEYPQSATGRPQLSSKYPESVTDHPDRFKPTSSLGEKRKPEASTPFNDSDAGYGTEHSDVTGRPSQPSKTPEKVKPVQRPQGYPTDSEHPQEHTEKYPEEITGKPEDHTIHSSHSPGGPKHPGSVDQTQEPQGSHGLKPEGVTYTPDGETENPDGVRPVGSYPEESGKPQYQNNYPERPQTSDTKEKPEYSTTNPEDAQTHYPEGSSDRPDLYPGVTRRPVSRPKPGATYPEDSKKPHDSNKHPEDNKATEYYPGGSKYTEGVTGRPEGTTYYPEGEEPYGTEYPGVGGRPQDPSKRPGTRPGEVTGRPEDESKYPDGVSGKPVDKTKYPDGSRPGQYPDPSKHPYGATDRPEGTTYYPEGEEPYATEYPGVSGRPKDPNKRPGHKPDGVTDQPELVTKYPAGVTSRPDDETKYPYAGKPGPYPDGSKYPEGVTTRPEAETKYPDRFRPGQHPQESKHPDDSTYPEGATGRPQDGSKYPVGVTGRPDDESKFPDSFKPDQHPQGSKYPAGATGRPEGTTYYPEGQEPYGTEYPGIGGKPKEPSKRPGTRPGEVTPRPEGDSKYPDGSKPEQYPDGVTGKPDYETKYPEEGKPGQYHDGTKYPDGITGTPDDKTKYPHGSRPAQYPDGVTGRPEGITYYPEGQESYGTEYPGVGGKPKEPSKHPGTRPGELTGRPDDNKYPAGVTGKPEDKTKHPEDLSPGQSPVGSKYPIGITGRPEEGIKYPEGLTSRPEATTYYPEGEKPYGTDYPGLGQRPKDPSKRPGSTPGDDQNKYPDGTKHPDGVTGRPETKYPEEGKPGQYPDGSKYPESVTGRPDDKNKYPHGVTSRPEGTTYYPDGVEPYGTENPGDTGRPKDPSKLPDTRPSDVTGRPEDGSEYTTGVSGRPQLGSKYPDESKYPEEATGRPADVSKYPYGSKPGQHPDETKYPEEVTGRPEDGNKYPDGSKPGQYPEETKYPDGSRPGQYPDEVTGRPGATTYYPEGQEPSGTEYPGVGGRPKDPSKRPGTSPGDENKYSEGSKYPESVTGRPDGETKYPYEPKPGQYPDDTKHPEGTSSRPQDGSIYPEGTKYPNRVTDRPDDETKYPGGSKYPDRVTGPPEDKNKYPDGLRPGQYPEVVTGEPEATTYYPDGEEPHGLHHSVVSGRPKDPSKRPESRPDGVTGRPQDGTEYSEELTGKPNVETKYPDGVKPEKYPHGSKYPEGITSRPEDGNKYPDDSKPDGSKHPEGVTGQPQVQTKYPDGSKPGQYLDESKNPDAVTGRPEATTHYPEGEESYGTGYPGVSGRPKDPSRRPGIKPVEDTGRPEDETKYPDGPKPGQYPDPSKHPYGVTDRPEGTTYYPNGEEPYGTEYPGVSGRPKDPSKRPGTRPGDDQTKYPVGSKYPEGVTGQPGDKTEYPHESKPGQYFDGVTGLPEATTYYPDGQEPYGTDYPGVSGRPKDPSKRPGSRPGEVIGRPEATTYYPDGLKPGQYPDGTNHPEGVTGGPDDKIKYPDGSKPGEHPHGSSYADEVTDRPEGTTHYPEGEEPYGTEYPGHSGRPTHPNKRPGSRPTGETSRPEDETKYPYGTKPGQYPDQSKHPYGVTDRPEGTTYYPEGEEPYATEYPGVSGRPKDPSKHPGTRPGDDQTKYPVGSKYPEGVTGQPGDKTEYPDGSKPGQYPDYIKQPEETTDRPQDGSKYPDGSKPGQHPDGSRPGHYPGVVTGRPEATTYYPDGQEPYGTDYPGVSGRPKDPSTRPGSRPGEVTGRPDHETKYPDGSKPGQYPVGVTGRPEGTTYYPDAQEPYGTDYPGVSGSPKDPSYRPGTRPSGVAHEPEHVSKYPDGSKPDQHPESFGPTDKSPLEPEYQTKYPSGVTERPEGQTDFSDVMTWRPVGQTHPEGDSHVTEHPELSGKPKYPVKKPEAIQSGKYPENVKPSDKHPDESKGKPEDHTKYPEGVRPDEHYPDGNKYPVDSKIPENIFKPSEKTPEDRLPEKNYPEVLKPIGEYPHGVTSRPGTETKHPESIRPTQDYPVDSKYPEKIKPSQQNPLGVTELPEGTTYNPEENYGTEYPATSGKPKDPSQYPDGVTPSEQHPDIFKPTQSKHPNERPEDSTKYTEDNKPTEQYPDGSKHPDKPEDLTKHPEYNKRPEGVTGKPTDESKYPEGITEQFSIDSKYPGEKPSGQYPESSDVTGKPDGSGQYPEGPDGSKHPFKPTEYYPDGSKYTSKPYPTGVTGRPEDHTEYPENIKPGQPEHPEGVTSQYPGVTGSAQYVTKNPEDDTGMTQSPGEHYPVGSKPSRPDDRITFPDSTSEQPTKGFEEFGKQPGLSSGEQHPGQTVRPEDNTKYPSVKPGEHQPEGSKFPVRPESSTDSTATDKYSEETFGTEYPEDLKPGQIGSKYPTAGKPTRRPGFKPSEYTTILPTIAEDTNEKVGVTDVLEYTSKGKTEQPSEASSVTTLRPIHKYPVKQPQKPSGFEDEPSGTEYPKTTKPDYEYDTERPDVTEKHPDDSKPEASRPIKPGTGYLPQGSDRPSTQSQGLDENSVPSVGTQTDLTPITELDHGKPVEDYTSRPRPVIPGEGLNNEGVTQKPTDQSASGIEVHPTAELTPDVKIPEGDLVAGEPGQYPSTDRPLESVTNTPVDESTEPQSGTNRRPSTTPDDDLINKLHNIISGIQSQTGTPSEQSTIRPQNVDKFGRPIPTLPNESQTTTKDFYVTDKPQGSGVSPSEEATQHADSSKPVTGHPSQGLSTESPEVFEEYPQPTGSDKTPSHLPTEDSLHTVTPQDGLQKPISTDKPLHVVYPTYYPDGVVTRKPGTKPDDGDKKVTVTPQSTHGRPQEQGETHTEYDVQTEISSETATTPGFVIVEEVHTEIHSERPTGRPIFGSAVTQSGNTDFTTHSGYQTEAPETTKPSYVTVTPAGTVSGSDHIMHVYSPKDKHSTSGVSSTPSFVTDPTVQHTRFPSRKTTQKPTDELTTHEPQGASYVPYKLVNSTKVYYPEKEVPQKPSESGPYDGYDHIPYEVVNGTKFFYPNRVVTEQPTTPTPFGMYVPYKVINGTKVYYTEDPPQEPEKYDGLDYVPFDIVNGTKVFYPERVSTTPSPTAAMYVPFKIVNGNKVYYSKDAKDEPEDVPDEYDGFDYVPFETENGKKVFHPERVPNHTPVGADYVPYKLVNNRKVYYPKDAQNEEEKIPEGYDGVDSVPYDIIDNEKVYYPEKTTPQKPAVLLVPYKLVNGTKVHYPDLAKDKLSELPEGYDGFDLIPYSSVNGTNVLRPEKITPKPAYQPNKMFVPFKIVNNTKVFYPKDAQNKPRPLKPGYDGVEYLPYDIVNGTKVFQPPTAPTSAMYVPYVIINGKKVYDPKKATENPTAVPEGYDGVDYLPYDIKDGSMIFYPEKTTTPAPKEGAMYVPYKLINGTKVYYADEAKDKPEDVPKEYDGFDYLPYELQNGNKIFNPDKVATPVTPTTSRPALYVPYKLVNGKKVYQTDKAAENPQDIPEEYDGFDYVPYDIKNGNKVFYPERVTPAPKEGAMYVPYKLNDGTKVYYADKATDKVEDVPKDFDGFDYIPYELQNGNKLFYPDRVATPTNKNAMYVPYIFDNGEKVYQTDKATDNPQGLPEEYDGFDYVPYDVQNGNKVFYTDRIIPTKGSEYVPYKIVKGMKIYHPENAADKTQQIPEEFDGFDYLPFETKNGNKIFYPDRVTQAPKGAIYVPYKLVDGKKVYNPNKATNNPEDIPKGYHGCDYIPYEIKDGTKVFHPEQITTPSPSKGFMYVPYKLINGTKVYYADKATDKQEEVPPEYNGLDYLPFEVQNGNKIFYPEETSTPTPAKTFKYIPYKLVNGRKVYYPDVAADKPEDIPKGYDGFDYLPIEHTKPQSSQGMFVPYKVINGTKVYYPQEAHKRPHPLTDEYSGLDYMPFETINGTKVFYPEREPLAKYVPYKIINGSKVFYPKDAKNTPEEIPAGYDGLDYVPYEVVNGSQIFHPDRVPEYQGMFVPYKVINGKKVFYPKYAQHKPMLMDGYDGFDYLPYENVNGTKAFKPEVPQQAMYVPYKMINGTKVYYPKHANRKPEVPAGYDGSDYIPYQFVNGTKVFDPSIRLAMYVPYKIIDGTKVYYPKHAQNKLENIPSGYDGHDYLPYEVINGNKVFKPEQAAPQGQISPQTKPAMYVPYKIVNGTKVYYPKHAQKKPEYIPNGYDGFDYLPYEIVNGNKVYKPEEAIPQEQFTPQIKQAMYVPYKIVNGTKVYHPKHAQNKPENIPDNYDGFDYLPYDIVNGKKVFKPEKTTPHVKQAMYVPYKIVNGTKVYHPKYAHNNPYLIPAGYDGFDYIPYDVVNGNKVFRPEQATAGPQPPKQAMYVPYKLVNGTKAYYPKHAQHAPTPVPFSYDGLDYLPYEVVNGTKIFEPQPHTKPTYLQGMFVPYKLSDHTKIFHPKDAHNKPHYVPPGYDGADYVPYETVNNTKLFYPELISMAQPSTSNIPGIYVPFRLMNNKKVFYPKEATPFPPTVRYPYDGVAFVPYKSSVPSEIIYVDEDDLTKPHTPSGHVPGEGNCYLNNKTYANNTEIAPVSPCQAKCTCISSIVRCVRVKCPPPPQNKLDCSPVYREGTCCPTYTCGDSEYGFPTTVGYPETKVPESTSHGHDYESTTAFTDLTSQKRKPGSEVEGKPGQQSEEYHLHKPPKPSEHESLEPYDNVEGHLSPEEDYDVEDEEPYGPGTCRYAGKVYVSAQQIPRDDPCDFCFCFRSDIICLQQSCPPPIPGCRDEPIEGFCCPRYECHVKMATLLNVTSTTTTTTTTLPPHFFPHAYKGSATRTGCFVQGKAYRVGQPIPSASGPCMDCTCGGNGRMKCEPKVCTPEPMIRKMMSPSENTTTATYER